MIESKQNQSFKLWQKLKLKKHRDAYGLFLIYGSHLVEIAQSKKVVKETITSNPDTSGTLISKELMKDLSQTETPYEIMAVCYKKENKQKSNKILILDNVQDPSNVGALLRSASAFGFMHVILSLRSADLYNEKVIRASKGAIFDLYVDRKPLDEAIIKLKEKGYQIIATNQKGKYEVAVNEKIALVLGNEGQGVSQEVFDLSDDFITIETDRVESLNVSVAGAILMHQWRKL